jgi:hypothetical protein
MSGNVEKIPRLEMRVHALVILRQQDWQKDVLTTSYLDHFLARQCMAEYLQMYYLWLQYKDDPERAGRAELEGSSLDQVGLARRGELTGGRSFR